MGGRWSDRPPAAEKCRCSKRPVVQDARAADSGATPAKAAALALERSGQSPMNTRFEHSLDRVTARIGAYFERGPLRRLLKSAALNLHVHGAAQLASAMAFDLFLALVPFLALLGWALSRLVRDDAHMMQNLSAWLRVTPSDVRNLVEQHAERFSGATLAPLAVMGGLWLASGAFDTVMAAFERTVPSHARSWWLRRVIAMACVVLLVLGLCLGAWVAVHLAGGPATLLGPTLAATRVDSVRASAEYPRVIGAAVSLITVSLLVAGFFRIGVHREGKRRVVWPGTIVTLLISAAVSFGFALYARTLAQYAFYYGSLAAVAVVLAWLWLCSFALLCGAEVNVHLEENPGFMRESLRPLFGHRNAARKLDA
jgi:membrane protein